MNVQKGSEVMISFFRDSLLLELLSQKVCSDLLSIIRLFLQKLDEWKNECINNLDVLKFGKGLKLIYFTSLDTNYYISCEKQRGCIIFVSLIYF